MGKGKIALLVIVMMASLAAASATLPAQTPASGMAALSGTVDSTAPFKAAQVFIRNVDKRIMYTVFTNAGQFRAVSLFPGNYEISAGTKELDSDVQKLVLKAADNPKLKVSLRATTSALRTTASAPALEEQSYDQIYPPGPGKDVAERTCIVCHGENFLPSRPGSAAAWTARLDRMMGTFLPTRAAASYAEGLLSYRAQTLGFSRQDRDDLLAYMVKHFGPDAKPRNVRVEQEMPLDEAKLGRAMYIEYYLPPDPPGKGVNAPEYNKLQAGFADNITNEEDVHEIRQGCIPSTMRV